MVGFYSLNITLSDRTFRSQLAAVMTEPYTYVWMLHKFMKSKQRVAFAIAFFFWKQLSKNVFLLKVFFFLR